VGTPQALVVMSRVGLFIGYLGLALFVGGAIYLGALAISARSFGWSIGVSLGGLLLVLIGALLRRVAQRGGVATDA